MTPVSTDRRAAFPGTPFICAEWTAFLRERPKSMRIADIRTLNGSAPAAAAARSLQAAAPSAHAASESGDAARPTRPPRRSGAPARRSGALAALSIAPAQPAASTAPAALRMLPMRIGSGLSARARQEIAHTNGWNIARGVSATA